MTQDRSYTTSEEYIFHLCDVESWEELCERATEIQPIREFLSEGLISMNVLISKMVEELTQYPNANKSAICRRIARKYGLSYHTVRGYVYRKGTPIKETLHALQDG